MHPGSVPDDAGVLFEREGTLSLPAAAGVALILSTLLYHGGLAVLFARAQFWEVLNLPREEKLPIIARHPASYRMGCRFVLIGWVAAALGFGLLTILLRDAGDPFISALAFIQFLIAIVSAIGFWALHVPVTLMAAEETADTARVPEYYESPQLAADSLIGVYILLGLRATAGFGWALLQIGILNPVPDVQVARTPAQIARGQQLAHACMSCHSPGSELPLSGTNFGAKFGFPPMMGTLYTPNLTPSGNISGWTDGEVIRAIREGVHKDGRSLLFMPSGNYRNLSDEDVQAIAAFLRSQPAAAGPTPNNNLYVLGAIFTNLTNFHTAQQPVGSVAAPKVGTPEYGKYMVDIIGCRDCHGTQLQGRVDTGQLGPPAGPNLTLIVSHWTEEEFMTFFNTGTLPGGGKVPIITLPNGFSEPRMPWKNVRAATTDDELRAMYLYLHGLPEAESPTR